MKAVTTIEAIKLKDGEEISLGDSPKGSMILTDDDEIHGFADYDGNVIFREYARIDDEEVSEIKEDGKWYPLGEFMNNCNFELENYYMQEWV